MCTFFIISPRVLKFCMKTPTHIWIKIGGQQNWFQKVKKISILNFAGKMVYKKLTPNDPYNSVLIRQRIESLVTPHPSPWQIEKIHYFFVTPSLKQTFILVCFATEIADSPHHWKFSQFPTFNEKTASLQPWLWNLLESSISNVKSSYDNLQSLKKILAESDHSDKSLSV